MSASKGACKRAIIVSFSRVLYCCCCLCGWPDLVGGWWYAMWCASDIRIISPLLWCLSYRWYASSLFCWGEQGHCGQSSAPVKIDIHTRRLINIRIQYRMVVYQDLSWPELYGSATVQRSFFFFRSFRRTVEINSVTTRSVERRLRAYAYTLTRCMRYSEWWIIDLKCEEYRKWTQKNLQNRRSSKGGTTEQMLRFSCIDYCWFIRLTAYS